MENYCKPATFIRVREFFTKFARALLLRIFLDTNQSLSFDSYHNMSLDKAWSRKLVAIQFSTRKSQNKVGVNKRWFTAFFHSEEHLFQKCYQWILSCLYALIWKAKSKQFNFVVLIEANSCVARRHIWFSSINWIESTWRGKRQYRRV